MLDSSGTLKSVRTDANLNSLNLLNTDGTSDGIAMSFGWMLLTDERPVENMGFDFFE